MTYADLDCSALSQCAALESAQHNHPLPIMRSLYLEYPNDPNTSTLDLQYLLGEEMLVASIFNQSGERHIYLPQGQWIDCWTDEVYQGSLAPWMEAPIDKIPLFILA